jgi:hypothetical protein
MIIFQGISRIIFQGISRIIFQGISRIIFQEIPRIIFQEIPRIIFQGIFYAFIFRKIFSFHVLRIKWVCKMTTKLIIII